MAERGKKQSAKKQNTAGKHGKNVKSGKSTKSKYTMLKENNSEKCLENINDHLHVTNLNNEYEEPNQQSTKDTKTLISLNEEKQNDTPEPNKSNKCSTIKLQSMDIEQSQKEKAIRKSRLAENWCDDLSEDSVDVNLAHQVQAVNENEATVVTNIYNVEQTESKQHCYDWYEETQIDKNTDQVDLKCENTQNVKNNTDGLLGNYDDYTSEYSDEVEPMNDSYKCTTSEINYKEDINCENTQNVESNTDDNLLENYADNVSEYDEIELNEEPQNDTMLKRKTNDTFLHVEHSQNQSSNDQSENYCAESEIVMQFSKVELNNEPHTSKITILKRSTSIQKNMNEVISSEAQNGQTCPVVKNNRPISQTCTNAAFKQLFSNNNVDRTVFNDVRSRSAVVYGLPTNLQLNEINEFFSQFHGVINIKIRQKYDLSDKCYKFNGSVFVTFNTREETLDFVKLQQLNYNSQPLKLQLQDKGVAKQGSELLRGSLLYFDGANETVTQTMVFKALANTYFGGWSIVSMLYNTGEYSGYVRFRCKYFAYKILKKIPHNILQISDTTFLNLRVVNNVMEQKYFLSNVENCAQTFRYQNLNTEDNAEWDSENGDKSEEIKENS